VGARIKRLLAVYAQAGGEDACLLLHNGGDSAALLGRLGRRALSAGRGLPARVLPLEVHHAASIGIDALLGAFAYGASQVFVLATAKESAEYGAAVQRQIAVAETVLAALGYSGVHFRWLAVERPDDLDEALWATKAAQAISKPAAFNFSAEKRATLEFAIEHIARFAPTPQVEIPLPAGALYGEVRVDKQKCTLCMACVGACPESALLDGRERPMLKFIERNCVQCGLCANTCPEEAISLFPRLLLAPQVRQEVVLNEAEPFNCVRCAKPFGTRQMVDNMLGKLAAHSMFAGGKALARLQMCGDCRVVDMMENKTESSIFDVKR
jgi:ferredoxin